ncbi:MAG: ABC transporter permease subunit [Deltaproteobacteria bacterium]|nr:ABC transporter permease subunit [Deltaproteobacteria bacterium]
MAQSERTTILWLELRETLRARWFQLYLLGFVGLMGLFFVFGLAESQVMGFHGLGRVLLTFIQVTLVVLPIFVLVTTARTLVGDREAGVWEYMLSMPVGFRSYYLGRFGGRTIAMIMPLVAALLGGATIGALKGQSVPWTAVVYYAMIVVALTVCFLGISMLISVTASSQEMAVGWAFAVWLLSEALVDALLLGLLIRQRLPADLAVGAAMLNPIQAFRTAAVLLFDPELTLLGPIAYTLLDVMGRPGLLVWAISWPTAVGVLCAVVGLVVFARRDVV